MLAILACCHADALSALVSGNHDLPVFQTNQSDRRVARGDLPSGCEINPLLRDVHIVRVLAQGPQPSKCAARSALRADLDVSAHAHQPAKGVAHQLHDGQDVDHSVLPDLRLLSWTLRGGQG